MFCRQGWDLRALLLWVIITELMLNLWTNIWHCVEYQLTNVSTWWWWKCMRWACFSSTHIGRLEDFNSGSLFLHVTPIKTALTDCLLHLCYFIIWACTRPMNHCLHVTCCDTSLVGNTLSCVTPREARGQAQHNQTDSLHWLPLLRRHYSSI